ncbi:MAG: acyltransferase [Pseudomonadota bacterium]
MFYRYKIPIMWLCRIIGILPRPILRWLYRLIQPIPGVLPVLLRYALIKNLCPKVGDNVYVGNDVTIHFFDRLSIGNNVSIHTQCYLDANGSIHIGSDVSIAHASSLVAFDHSWGDPSTPIRKNPLVPAPITIESDVWIGAGVRILAGASLPSRTVVAAGAVVSRTLAAPPGSLLGGVPARVLRELAPAGEELGDSAAA